MTKVLITFFLLCLGLLSHAQDTPRTDSLIVERNQSSVSPVKGGRDTVLLKSYATRYDPRKALLYAAVFPGLGQAYTKKYWKIPLIYGGMGFLGYRIDFYQKGYTKYKLELFSLLDDRSLTTSASGFNETQLRTIVNRARRERDFMIIIMGLVYVLQMVDAHVDAHLKEFDLNPNLQVRFEPILENDVMLGRQAGFSMKIRF